MDGHEGSSAEAGDEDGGTTGEGDASQSGDVQLDSGTPDSVRRQDGTLPDALADADAPECPPDEPAPPTTTSTSTITFVLTNTSGSDRWLLTGATDCEAFSVDGVLMALPPQPACAGGMYPPEQLHFQKIAAGASANLTWDARGLVLYTTYQGCSGVWTGCLMTSNGSPQAVNPGQWTAQFAVASMAPAGPRCSDATNGDVVCTVTMGNGNPQRGGQCTWPNVSLMQQTFTVPDSGAMNVDVALQ